MFRVVKRIIKWANCYKKRIYIGFVFAFISGIFMAMPIVFTAMGLGLIIDDVNGVRPVSGQDIFILSILMIAAIFGRFLFSYLRAIMQDTVGYEKLAEQRINIGNILKRVPLGFFKENSTGELVSAITTDLSFMEMHAISMLDTVVNGYITVIAMIICLAFYNGLMVMIAVAGLLLSTFFLWCMSRKSRNNAPVHQKTQDSMIAATIEYLRGIALVKSFNQEGASYDGIRDAFQKSKKINIKIEKEYAIFNFLHMFSLKTAAVCIIGLTAYMTLNGMMEFSVMVLLDILSFVIFSSAEGLSSAAHVLEIIDTTMDKLERMESTRFIDENGKSITPITSDIEFKNVSFAYGKNMVIKNMSFLIPHNSTTAIVGPSGSGKTTLCSLIARFYDVSAGKILLGNYDLREYTCDSLLNQISMVFQKVYLFHDTIANNISFGKPEATYDEIVEVAKKARCHDFIMQLPEKYNTVINEGGVSLSGGEKQRISIARAILKDAPVVILDEATSSVDPENEHIIQQAIAELTQGKTIITIAHRLATIENADQILVMDNGNLSQRGTHQELLEQKGIYQKFVSIRKKAEGWSIENF